MFARSSFGSSASLGARRDSTGTIACRSFDAPFSPTAGASATMPASPSCAMHGVVENDQPPQCYPEEEHRTSRSVAASRVEDRVDVGSEVLPRPHVHSVSARKSVASRIEAMQREAALEERRPEKGVRRCPFAEAVDEHDGGARGPADGRQIVLWSGVPSALAMVSSCGDSIRPLTASGRASRLDERRPPAGGGTPRS